MGLKELLGEELFGQVTAALKGKGKDNKDVELIINDGNYIPRAKFNELNEKVKSLEKEIATRDEQLKDLGEKAKGNEELTKQIAALTEANTKTKAEYEAKLKDITLNTAIEKALTANQAKYVDLLVGKIDKSKLVLDGEKVIGLDEQITGLKEAFKDLFGETRITGKDEQSNPGANPTQKPISEMSMEEYAKFWQEQNN